MRAAASDASFCRPPCRPDFRRQSAAPPLSAPRACSFSAGVTAASSSPTSLPSPLLLPRGVPFSSLVQLSPRHLQGPIVVATHNYHLDDVLAQRQGFSGVWDSGVGACGPPVRHSDLVLVQNGLLDGRWWRREQQKEQWKSQIPPCHSGTSDIGGTSGKRGCYVGAWGGSRKGGGRGRGEKREGGRGEEGGDGMREKEAMEGSGTGQGREGMGEETVCMGEGSTHGEWKRKEIIRRRA
ncbi:unnamed protein product [Closterium sp. NIES-64]|nr:unnamed protein product [Closterium sp. NIES-64]